MIEIFDIESGEELTKLYLKKDKNLLADDFERFNKKSFEEYGINPLFCVSLPGYTWHCRMKHSDIKLQTLQDKDSIFRKLY